MKFSIFLFGFPSLLLSISIIYIPFWFNINLISRDVIHKILIGPRRELKLISIEFRCSFRIVSHSLQLISIWDSSVTESANVIEFSRWWQRPPCLWWWPARKVLNNNKPTTIHPWRRLFPTAHLRTVAALLTTATSAIIHVAAHATTHATTADSDALIAVGITPHHPTFHGTDRRTEPLNRAGQNHALPAVTVLSFYLFVFSSLF